MKNFYYFDFNFKNKVFTSIYDKENKLICVLINGRYEKQFNLDVLKNFDEFYIYNEKNRPNYKIIDFINNYEFFEK